MPNMSRVSDIQHESLPSQGMDTSLRKTGLDQIHAHPSVSWHSTLTARACFLLIPWIAVVTILHLSSSSVESARSTFSLIIIDLPSSSLQLAVSSVGSAETNPDGAFVRRKEILAAASDTDGAESSPGASGQLSLTAWGWCAGEDPSSSSCSPASLFTTIRQAFADTTDDFLRPENFSRVLLHMLALHVLASVASLVSLGFICWHLWKLRASPDGSARPGWSQYGPVLGTAILSSIASIADLVLISALQSRISSAVIRSGTGVILAGIGAILSWLTLIVWGGPALRRSIRSYFVRQRQFAMSYGQQHQDDLWDAEAGHAGVDEGDEDDGDDRKLSGAVKGTEEKSPKRRRGWLSRRPKESSRSSDHRRRYDDRSRNGRSSRGGRSRRRYR